MCDAEPAGGSDAPCSARSMASVLPTAVLTTSLMTASHALSPGWPPASWKTTTNRRTKRRTNRATTPPTNRATNQTLNPVSKVRPRAPATVSSVSSPRTSRRVAMCDAEPAGGSDAPCSARSMASMLPTAVPTTSLMTASHALPRGWPPASWKATMTRSRMSWRPLSTMAVPSLAAGTASTTRTSSI
ncbi:unnamed protein product [Ectocarpus fasciculatus]